MTAADLSDSLDWIGPELLALVGTPARTVHQAITNGILVPRSGTRPLIDDTKRPFVAAQTARLAAVLDQDDVLVAAWRDLVAGCRDLNHVLYPSERIAFLRDTSAASSIEYAVIASGIAVAIAATITILSGSVQGLFVTVLTAL